MGLFSGFGGKSSFDRAFNKFEAVSGVLLSVVASDGDISDEEAQMFNYTVNRHPVFTSQSSSEYSKMIKEQFSLLDKHGWRKLCEKSASHVPPELRNTVFALAVDLVLSDGRVEKQEEDLIDSLTEILMIDTDDARNMIAVLAIKNGTEIH